jgi:hypothetical protein
MPRNAKITTGSHRHRGRVGLRKDPRRSHFTNGSAHKSAQQSAITNGSRLLPNVDGRSAWIRRAKDVITLHVADLGGVENISTAELSLIRRAAALTVELEMMEASWADAGQATPAALDLYSRTAGNLRRLLETLGLKRRSRDVTPTLSDALRRASP